MDIIGQLINAVLNVHPWHSPIVHFPIGLTGGALLFILLARWRRNESLEHAAFFMISLAAVFTVLAAVTGLRDNIVRFDGAAPLAPVKIVLGITLFILTTVTAISRWRRRELLWTPTTTVMYLAAFAGSFGLAMTLGFIGGVILYGI
ncbi:MAG TPA: DUF2231 domain-containing protein [Anaerolineae bacterium]|nr:DUF2231 domain-containing protein [Anaerolineae bacterium]